MTANQAGRRDDMDLAVIDEEYFEYADAIAYLHEKGLRHVTYRTLVKAAYEGRRPLKRTKIGGRIYFARSDVDSWVASSKMDD
jgi:hypothetical protein